MPSPYNIPTALPFDRLAGAGNPYQATNPQQLGDLYASGHSAAAGMNQANLANINTGYENILSAQSAAQQQAHAGYGQLGSDVLSNLNLAGTTERQNIADQYARSSGDLSQSMLNSGLGNSTVQASLQRGLLLDRTKANNDVMERVGNLKAGYQSQIGQAGLGFDERAIGANTGLGLNQLGMMERINVPYPQAQAYQAVASQMGAAQQQNADRDLMTKLGQQQAAAAGRAGAVTPTMPGGGSGFFRQPNPQGGGGSGYSGEPISYGVPARSAPPQFGPPPGVTLDAHPDAFSYGSGLTSPYAAPPGQGFGGGFGDQNYGMGSPQGEDQPYGQPNPGLALQTAGSPYGSYGQGAGIDAQLNQLSNFYFGEGD